jgi:hypothetical protein
MKHIRTKTNSAILTRKSPMTPNSKTRKLRSKLSKISRLDKASPHKASSSHNARSDASRSNCRRKMARDGRAKVMSMKTKIK